MSTVIHPPRSEDTGRMVLIVEDERFARHALAHLLAQSGYTTAACGSAEEALEDLDGGRVPEVALVDVDLPGMSGLDLVPFLEKRYPGLLTVLMTAVEGDRITFFRRDHDVQYLRKPVDFSRLLTILDSLAGTMPALSQVEQAKCDQGRTMS
ncbi:MAG: response regulator [Tepidisphaeraceae bacterium]